MPSCSNIPKKLVENQHEILCRYLGFMLEVISVPIDVVWHIHAAFVGYIYDRNRSASSSRFVVEKLGKHEKKPFYTVWIFRLSLFIKRKNALWKPKQSKKRLQGTLSNQKSFFHIHKTFLHPFQSCWWLLILSMNLRVQSFTFIATHMSLNLYYAWMNFPFE